MKDNLIEFAEWWKSVYKEKLAAVYINERYEMNPKAVYRKQEAEYCYQEENDFYANPTDKNRNLVLRKRAEFTWNKIKEFKEIKNERK